ncbi:protein FAR1-RELATED SEQUENCE 5-like [Fagus crenata]
MSGALRSIHVCHHVSQLSYLAEISEEMYEMIIYDLENTLKKAFVMESQILQGTENNEMNLHQPLAGHSNGLEEAQDCSPNVPLNIKDPHISQTKGRKKSTEKQSHNGRFKSGLEMSLARKTVKRRACLVCGEHGHNRRTCKQYKGEGSDHQEGENTTTFNGNNIDDSS